MVADDSALIALALGTIGTYALRALPVTAISRLKLPEFIQTWLVFVAEAVLSAYVVLFLFWDATRSSIRIDPGAIFAISVVIVVHLRKRNLLLSVFAGTMIFGLFNLWISPAATDGP